MDVSIASQKPPLPVCVIAQTCVHAELTCVSLRRMMRRGAVSAENRLC